MNKLLPKTSHNPNGFTLVELLVVITIIAILSMVGLVAFSDAQKNARDAKRKADINAIAKALESNYTANSGTPYASVVGSWFVGGNEPTNPSPGGATYVKSALPAASFTVCATLEKSTGNADDTAGTGYNVNSANKAFYCVKNSQ